MLFLLFPVVPCLKHQRTCFKAFANFSESTFSQFHNGERERERGGAGEEREREREREPMKRRTKHPRNNENLGQDYLPVSVSSFSILGVWNITRTKKQKSCEHFPCRSCVFVLAVPKCRQDAAPYRECKKAISLRHVFITSEWNKLLSWDCFKEISSETFTKRPVFLSFYLFILSAHFVCVLSTYSCFFLSFLSSFTLSVLACMLPPRVHRAVSTD